MLLATGATPATMANAFGHLLAGFPSMQRRVASAAASAGVAAFPFLWPPKNSLHKWSLGQLGQLSEPEIDVRCLWHLFRAAPSLSLTRTHSLASCKPVFLPSTFFAVWFKRFFLHIQMDAPVRVSDAELPSLYPMPPCPPLYPLCGRVTLFWLADFLDFSQRAEKLHSSIM